MNRDSKQDPKNIVNEESCNLMLCRRDELQREPKRWVIQVAWMGERIIFAVAKLVHFQVPRERQQTHQAERV